MQMATQLTRWTLAELHRLPDDGNKYELVRGELFVTPPPTDAHEAVLSRLTRILDPFVAANDLGLVYHPRAVIRFDGSEVEPDLMVRSVKASGGRDWDDAPTPWLVVEVLSDSTRRRDLGEKRQLYLDAGVPEYWVVDPEARTVRVMRPSGHDQSVADRLEWAPERVHVSLTIDVPAMFG